MNTTNLSGSQLLGTSWFDSAHMAGLNQHNVLDYFCQRSNPFYDRICNNEVVRMQRADPSQLLNMTGTEYMLLHVQEPILYVIRKLHRQSPDKVTPLADYYILGGVVYQCPDLWSIINSRLLSTLHLVNTAFAETISYARYDPNKDYYWEFPDNKKGSLQLHPGYLTFELSDFTWFKADQSSKSGQGARPSDEPSEVQRRRVDVLLNEVVKKFPPKVFTGKEGGKPQIVGGEKPKVVPEAKEATAALAGIKRPGQFTADSKAPDPKKKRT